MSFSQKTSAGIRPCEAGDIEQVSRLFRESFPKKKLSEEDLCEFFHDVYLDNPWADENIPSLVFDRCGTVEGFLGVIPGRMKFQGDPVIVAVSSAFMVKKDRLGKRNPLTGVNLLRQFLNGDQDFSVADGANDLTRNIWTKSGGAIAYPYSYTWTRPLQPLQSILELEAVPASVRRMAQPGMWLGDQFLKRVSPMKPSKPGCLAKDIDTSDLIELLQKIPAKSIMPDYRRESLQWLVGKAEHSKNEGHLAKRVVLSEDGKTLGWYIYYRKTNGIGRVLQWAALPRSVELVLDSLIYEAHCEGLAALRGRAEPEHLSVFNKRFCAFQGRPWFLVHSTEPKIVQSFQNADVFFSGLEGEHWLKTNAC